VTDARVAQVTRALAASRRDSSATPAPAHAASRQPCQVRCVQTVGYSVTIARGPDLLGMTAYAGYLDPIAQSGHVMRGYKNPSIPKGTHWQTAGLMSALGLIGHGHARTPSRYPDQSMGHDPLPATEAQRRVSSPQRNRAPSDGSGRHRGRPHGQPVVSNPRAIDQSHFAVADGRAAHKAIMFCSLTTRRRAAVTSCPQHSRFEQVAPPTCLFPCLPAG
jgi:hypothetical protein